MDYKEKDKQKAKEIAQQFTKVFGVDYFNEFSTEDIYNTAMLMAEYKNKEFEDLINGLPTPIKELIKAFKNS